MTAKRLTASLAVVLSLGACTPVIEEIGRDTASGNQWQVGGRSLVGSFEDCVDGQNVEGGLASTDLPSSSTVWTLTADSSEADAVLIAECLQAQSDSGQVIIFEPINEG